MMSVGLAASLLVTIFLPRTLDYPYIDSSIPLPAPTEGQGEVEKEVEEGDGVAGEREGERVKMIPKGEQEHVIVMDRNLLTNQESEAPEFSVE